MTGGRFCCHRPVTTEPSLCHTYFIFADLEDRRYGGKCTNRTIALKHYDLGAHAVQNSDYRCTEQLFDAFPLRRDDVFVDVGEANNDTLSLEQVNNILKAQQPRYSLQLLNTSSISTNI